MKELPKSWVECKLGDILAIQNGYAFSSRDFKNKGVPLIRQSNLAGKCVSLDKCVYLDPGFLEIRRDFVLKKNDVLIGMSGSIGKLCIYDLDQPALQNQRTGKIKLFSKNIVEWRFIWEYLKTIEGELKAKSKGLGVNNVSSTDIESMAFVIPPLSEQRRIVAKLEKLLAKVDACKERLEKIPAILKRFRQSVLAAACSGQLTAGWRKEMLGVEMLAKKIEESNSISEHTLTLPGIPQQWSWLRLEELCSKNRSLTYGVIKLGAPHYGGIPTLRSSDVRWLNVDLANAKRIAPDIANSYQRTLLQGGEVLITVRGSLGGVSVAPERAKGFNISREVAVAPIKGQLNSHYISYAIASNWSQNWLADVAKGVAYTGINIRDLRLLPIPMPPVPEQHEIVRRVEALFKIADAIEKRYEKAKAQVDKLTQSILAKAFRGELVPQDPNDEPASELLKRIQEERKKKETENKMRRRSKQRE